MPGLSRAPVALARRFRHLLARVLRLTVTATLVAGLLIVLDRIFLPDEPLPRDE